MTFKISTVEKTMNISDDALAQLWLDWMENSIGWGKVIDRAAELAELETLDYVVDVVRN